VRHVLTRAIFDLGGDPASTPLVRIGERVALALGKSVSGHRFEYRAGRNPEEQDLCLVLDLYEKAAVEDPSLFNQAVEDPSLFNQADEDGDNGPKEPPPEGRRVLTIDEHVTAGDEDGEAGLPSEAQLTDDYRQPVLPPSKDTANVLQSGNSKAQELADIAPSRWTTENPLLENPRLVPYNPHDVTVSLPKSGGTGVIRVNVDGTLVPFGTFAEIGNGPSLTISKTVITENFGVVKLDGGGFTKTVFEKIISAYKARYGMPPSSIPGELVEDNLRTFQQEYSVARTENPTSSISDWAQTAIRNTSFGKALIAVGYKNFDVVLGKMRNRFDLNDGTAPLFDVPRSVSVVGTREWLNDDGAGPAGDDSVQETMNQISAAADGTGNRSASVGEVTPPLAARPHKIAKRAMSSEIDWTGGVPFR